MLSDTPQAAAPKAKPKKLAAGALADVVAAVSKAAAPKAGPPAPKHSTPARVNSIGKAPVRKAQPQKTLADVKPPKHDLPAPAKRDLFDNIVNTVSKVPSKNLLNADPTRFSSMALKRAGINVPTLSSIAGTAIRAGAQVGRATIEDPKDVAEHTVKSVPALAAGSIAGLAEAVMHPKHLKDLPAQEKADLKRRYGNLSSDPAAFRARIKKEGAAPEVIDALTLAAPEGASLGRGVTKVAKTGMIGKAAKRLVEEDRPALRLSAGAHAVRDQDLSPNIFRAIAQKTTDKSRVKAFAKRQEEAASGGDGVRGLIPGEGEVVHKSLKAQRRAQRRGVNTDQARAQIRLKRLQSREINHGSRKEVHSLNRAEKRSLKYVIQLGLPADAKTAARELRQHRAKIVAARKDGVKIRGNDELPVIDKILADPQAHFTQRLRDVADQQVARGKRTAALDPDLTGEQAVRRQVADQAAHLGINTEGMTAAELTRAVSDAAQQRGLHEPGYRYSPGSASGAYSPYTTGALNRAVAGNKSYTGHLFRTGQQDVKAEAMHLGYARNIKRGINWKGVADVWERNTPDWGRNKRLRDLEHAIVDRKLDPRDWRFVDTEQFRKEVASAGEDTRRATDGTDGSVHAAAKASTYTLDGLPADFASTGRRLSLVPRAVADELEASTHPSGEFARVWKKMQAAQSKAILNLNPSFVPVQVASNAPLSLLAMHGNAKDLLAGQKWYHGLDQQAKDAVDDYIGVSASEAFTHGGRIGASADTRLGGFFEAVADNPKVQWAGRSKVNPLNWNPWMDDKQNAFFRRAVFYNQAKRQAARAIGKDMAGVTKEARPLMDVLKMAPGPEREAAIRAAEPQFEKIADHVDSMLGNYTRYSASERKILRSSLLFYGFLRWSVQFTFYTLPVKHPIAAAITAKLGQLHNEEVINLLSDNAAAQGIAPKDKVEEVLRSGAVPYVFGRIWMKKNGKLESIDVSRVNPMLNPIMDALQSGPAKAGAGLVSPILQSTLDLAYGRSLFSQQDLKNSQGNPLGDNPRYVLGQALRTMYPVRLADKLTHPGSESDDSVPLISPRNADTHTPAAQAREQQKKGERGSNKEIALDSLFPLVRSKQDGTMRGVAAAVDAASKAASKKAKASGSGQVPSAGGVSVSQAEIDKLLQSTQTAEPSVSQAEIDKLLKQASGGK